MIPNTTPTPNELYNGEMAKNGGIKKLVLKGLLSRGT